MKRQSLQFSFSQLCQSARVQLDDHHLNKILIDPRLLDEAKEREALYQQLKQQLLELNSDQSSSAPMQGGD